MWDALARVRRTGDFVESKEVTAANPYVSSVMSRTLSDRIPADLPREEFFGTFERCFGEDEVPSGEGVRNDEQVLVLSYRHESRDVRMRAEDGQYCYQDLAQVTIAHGKRAMRVWTDKLASNTRGDSLWLDSGVEPYRNAVVVAFNGQGDSIFVDRFWLSLERSTGMRAWGYWLRDDLGQLMRLGNSEYPARTEDQSFLSRILFTPGRGDGPLWEEDGLEVLREAARKLHVTDIDSLWDAHTFEFLPRRYSPFKVVDVARKAGERKVLGKWSPAADVLVDREMVEKALGFEVRDRSSFSVRKWYSGDGGVRFVAVKSKVSEDWFCARVDIVQEDSSWRVEDVTERCVLSSGDLGDAVVDLRECKEVWI